VKPWSVRYKPLILAFFFVLVALAVEHYAGLALADEDVLAAMLGGRPSSAGLLAVILIARIFLWFVVPAWGLFTGSMMVWNLILRARGIKEEAEE
jgi:hypothetical protein